MEKSGQYMSPIGKNNTSSDRKDIFGKVLKIQKQLREVGEQIKFQVIYRSSFFLYWNLKKMQQ
jgi:hypothetical protein